MPADLLPIPHGDQAWLGTPTDDQSPHQRGTCGHCSATLVFAHDGEPLGVWTNSPPASWPFGDADAAEEGEGQTG